MTLLNYENLMDAKSNDLLIVGGHQGVGKTVFLESMIAMHPSMESDGILMFSKDHHPFDNDLYSQSYNLRQMTILEVFTTANNFKQRTGKLHCIIIDSLSAIGSKDKKEDWIKIVKTLKEMAVELSVPVIVLADFSLSHKSYPWTGEQFALNFLVRQQASMCFADKVLLLHRYDFQSCFDDKPEDKARHGFTYLILGKGFDENNNKEIFMRFERHAKRLEQCKNQEEVRQEIDTQVKLLKNSFVEQENKTKEHEKQNAIEEMLNRIDDLENEIEECKEEIAEIRKSLVDLGVEERG